MAEAMSISGMSNNSVLAMSSNLKIQDARPVLLGGTHKGWNAEISVVLWRRMLGVLGDLNDIPDPAMHKLAFECLVKITDDFIKIKDNISYLMSNSNNSGDFLSGVINNNNQQSQLLQPSLHYFTAWLFRATTLPNEFKAGKLLAYKLLCIIALHRCEQCGGGCTMTDNSSDFMNSNNNSAINTITIKTPDDQSRDFFILFYLAIKRALATYDMVSMI